MVYKMKFTPQEVMAILVRHLIIEGQIGEVEGQTVKELEKKGKNYLLEFETKT